MAEIDNWIKEQLKKEYNRKDIKYIQITHHNYIE
jgi:hypothetical protein